MTNLDLAIIVIYIVAVIAVGIICRGKQDNASDYFTTHGHMNGIFGSILVGMSIAATLFSGITFMAYPSIVYTHGIMLILMLVTLPVCWVILRYWFLPRFLSIESEDPYGFIEIRLGKSVRMTAAIMFALLRIGWMAALIYAPTIAIMAAARLDDSWFWPLVLLIGLSSSFYTVIGGIRGVIVTDAIQFIMIILGILFTVVYILINLPVPLAEALADLKKNNLLGMPSFSFDPTLSFTFWTITIGMFIGNMGSYAGDQMSLQRYLATGNIKSCSHSFLVNIAGVMLVIILLGTVGLMLAAWYHSIPDSKLPSNPDLIFPYFIASQLPPGIAGILLAAILAATMSSITSGINALSATVTLDFYAKLKKNMTSGQELRVARYTSLVIGLASTLLAGCVDGLGDIFTIAQSLLGVFIGPLLACSILALLPFTLSQWVIISGMIMGTLAGIVVVFSSASPLWVSPVAFLIALMFPTLLFKSRIRDKI